MSTRRLFGARKVPARNLKVLVAIDDSSDSRAAITWLPDWFDNPKTSVTVASVVPDDAAPEAVQAAWSRVSASRSAIAGGKEAHVVVLAGDPASALRHYAKNNDVHVLVLGTRGEGRTQSSLGRVANAFARDSGMVVLYVEDDAARSHAE